MRLHRLELEGFGPFRERQVVDFDAFADDGIFLIAGRTGAGKSSVLDGVCFALYGGVPRYDGMHKRLRSDHCEPHEPTSVSVEFTAAGRRWRVTRSPEYERPKQRGEGLTTEPHRAELHEFVDGHWQGRAARPVDVADELDEILGLSQQQFLQVILLAQNRFAEFLLARNDDRQRVLRRLFGTRTYEQYQESLEQRRRAAEREVDEALATVGMLLDEAEVVGGDLVADGDASAGDIVARLAAIEVLAQRAAYRAETLVRERDAADAAHRAADERHRALAKVREQQEQRSISRAALARLEAEAESVAADRVLLERAIAAEALRATIEDAERDRAAARAAEEAVEEARAEWCSVGGSGDDAIDALRAQVEQLTGGLAVWAAAREEERRLATLDQQLAADRAAVEELTSAAAQIDDRRAAVPALLETLDVELANAREAAGALPAAEERRADLAARRSAASEAQRLAEQLTAAEAQYLHDSASHDRARAHVTDLLRRRLAGHAGELAAALVDGEPCAVCGSTAHPDPARGDAEPVTDEAIAAAESVRDAAAAAEKTSAAAAAAARSAHVDAVARAGGATTAELDVLLAEADAALAAAREACAVRDRTAQQRAEVVAADTAAAQERTTVSARLEELRTAVDVGSAERARVRAEVEAARGDFATVAERIEHETIRRDAAVRLADRIASASASAAVAAQAETDRDARVAASDFDHHSAATSALRDAAERARIDDRVRAHESALQTERARLRDLELALAGEQDELLDLAPATAALAAARDAWAAAVDSAAHAAQRSARLADLAERARTAHTAVAGPAGDLDVIVRLADTVAGRAPNTHRMTLESFVLAAELEEIVAAANVRLEEMSAGRYRLQHSDARAARGAASGLGLEIMDAHTGQARPAQSLSGGETFLASLSLALGLAEVVTGRAGGVRLDTLFIDEGFGALDDETLDVAMRTLDELRQGGRTVGLISHVAAMKEQLPAQLLVEATAEGPSVIHQGAGVAAS
ncbi:SMC family ATPase [Microbacterium awajiense]|uniref:Nuclease SbcCD subunit C n=1 Tax=Microbacterium awajiense TaxID=415214 RepID=A0ABP7AXT6_9MICO